jgi:zinc protease
MTGLTLVGWVLALQAAAGVAVPPAPPPPSPADTLPPIGRAGLETLSFPDLVFEAPVAVEREVLGVPVFHLHDPTLPLVDVFVHVRGGLAHLDRELMAPVTALPGLLHSGGTRALPPDSVEARLDLMAVQVSFGGGGGASSAAMNALTHTVDEALDLLREILLEPGFDEEAVDIWRGRELDRVRRREDDPTGLAYSEFNRLVFGDHPVGWVMDEEDLLPEALSPERLREVHGRLFCRENLTVGIAGDLPWNRAQPRIRQFIQAWPSCQEELPEPRDPEMLRMGAIFILPKEVEQTTIVMAHPGGIVQEDSRDFFASRVADRILGGGGLTSRLMDRLRTELGLTYGAASIWTAPLRHEGLLGAVTSTRPDRTVEAVRTLLETFADFRDTPPGADEVARARDEITNGYVFAFESPSQVVARGMSHRVQELPDNWLERFLEGIQEVTAEDVARAVRDHIHPDRMTILLVGDPARFEEGLGGLGPLYRLHPDGRWEEWPAGDGDLSSAAPPHGSPQSPR